MPRESPRRGGEWQPRLNRYLTAGLVVAVVCVPLLLLATANNPPLGYTGAPGDFGTCAACHVSMGTGPVSVNFPTMTYTPGGPAVIWTVTAPGGGNGGFELSPRVNSNNTEAGNLTSDSNSSIRPLNGFEYASQTVPATSWTLQWTPPATNVGAVTVYVTGVDTDTNCVNAGCSYAATYTLTPAAAGPSGLVFVPATPCRVADTRNATGPFGGPEMAAGETRSFAIPQSACSIPATAAAYSLNVTAVPNVGFGLGYLSLWPAGDNQPVVSTLNSDGRVKANAAIVAAAAKAASASSSAMPPKSSSTLTATSSPVGHSVSVELLSCDSVPGS